MTRRARAGAAGENALRVILSAGNLRSLLGIVDRGRVLLARARAATGEALTETTGGRDVLVRVVDVLHELPMLARLHIPGNILWSRPRAEDTGAVVVPADATGPGGPVFLHGDAGTANAVPPWWSTARGLFGTGPIRVESADDDVVVHAPAAGKAVKLGAAATKAVNRTGDPTNTGTLSVVATSSTLTMTFTPPGGAPVVFSVALAPPAAFTPSPLVTFTLAGATGPGSTKVKAED